MSAPEKPRVLSGRYELLNLVARGGMAEVYRAHDRLLDRPVALKILFPELSVDRSFVERFRREAQAAANLSHPNIVPVFDWGEDFGTYFIVMEYVDGQTLSSILRSAGPLHPERAAEIAADVAFALAYAHRHGVVHRDVKPGNVLITHEGAVKVTDFGIARAVNTEESLTQTGAVMGTATYFSPEQAEGLGVDGKSDIYSLGVVLYEMVAGRPPFLGETPVAVASKHVRETPLLPRQVNPNVPPDLEAVIMKCMAKSPEHRYANGDELRADLLRFRDGRGVTAGVPTAWQAVEHTSTMASVGRTQTMRPPVGGYETESHSRTGLYAALLVLLLAALAVVVVFLGNSLGWWHITSSNAVTLPNLSGQSLSQAERTVVKDGLKYAVTADSAATSVSNTQVVSTDPAGGTKMTKGQTVTLVTGNKGNKVQLSSYADESVVDAESEVRGQGLQPQEQYSSNCTQINVVCSQSPTAGTYVNPGSTVILFTAPSSTTTTVGTAAVPDVSGDSETEACSILGHAGFTCGATVTLEASSQYTTAGEVISTDPPAGTQEPEGTTVDLTVSNGNVTVPDVIGLGLSDAETALQDDDLTAVSSCTDIGADPSNDGDVASQDPSAGTSVTAGSAVDLTYYGCSSTTTTTSDPGGGGGGFLGAPASSSSSSPAGEEARQPSAA